MACSGIQGLGFMVVGFRDFILGFRACGALGFKGYRLKSLGSGIMG